MPRSWGRMLLLIAAAAGFWLVVVAAALLARRLGLPKLEGMVLAEAVITVYAVAVALAAGGFRALGLSGGWKAADVGAVIGLFALSVVGSVVTTRVGSSLGLTADNAAVPELLKMARSYSAGSYFLLTTLVALLAGISEELFFRGYLITRLEALKVPGWACVLLTGFAFGFAHFSGQGLLTALGFALFMGVPAGCYFWKRRSLWPLIAYHTLRDVFGFATVLLAAKSGMM
ncbi:MAG TPA: CPBP family intramembrane glutamic endopeptidase [Symbiobacteriaceae bacterium]|nr:CPBP family intramembrane glutamic endopeptidase [Symbiobacteriaceae bacterium]